VRTVRSLFSTGTITREIVTRAGVDIVFIRVDLDTTSPPTAVELNQRSVTLTDVTSDVHFKNLKNDSGTNLPLDSSGATIEGYKNSNAVTGKNQVILFGVGLAATPSAIYRGELDADRI
tara:strand:+ start:318 stop:674 length:357 start_codon:yes stop_codon:yes gene_type:complete